MQLNQILRIGVQVASGLAAALEKEFGVRSEMIKSSGGVFEVTVNGELIYSKKATGRFPEHDEIFYHVKAALPSADA